ncbi:MAG: hypothetical protein KJZ75_13990 [Hyphomonadaceae bacterium]|nr:hypothetical protein [Hyphomonadaceae bacterium]
MIVIAPSRDDLAKRFETRIRAAKLVSKREARVAANKCAAQAARLMRLLPSVTAFQLIALKSPAGITFGLVHSVEGLNGSERDISETIERECFERFAEEYGFDQ